MTSFETIDICTLASVTGGEGASPSAPNREEVRIGIQTGGRTRINIGAEGTRSRTDYAVCVQETRAARGTPRDIRETCGLPPS